MSTIEPFDLSMKRIRQTLGDMPSQAYDSAMAVYQIAQDLRAERDALRAKILALKDDPSCVTVEAALLKAAGMV